MPATSEKRYDTTQVAPQLYAALDLLHKDVTGFDARSMAYFEQLVACLNDLEINQLNMVQLMANQNSLIVAQSNKIDALNAVMNKVEVNTRKTT